MRRNYPKRNGRDNDIRQHYDSDVISRPREPHIKYFIDPRRKTVFRNLDAYWDAEGKKILYKDVDWAEDETEDA